MVCRASSVLVGTLAPGNYTVKWQQLNLGPMIDLGTYHFSVGQQAVAAVPLFGVPAALLLCAFFAVAGALALRR